MPKIFESPDKGDTIYEREFGSADRVLVKDTRGGHGKSLHEAMMENKMWGEIQSLGRTNPTMRDELDRVIALYHLLKEAK